MATDAPARVNSTWGGVQGIGEKMSRQRRRRRRLLSVRCLTPRLNDPVSDYWCATGCCHQTADLARHSGPVRVQERGEVLEYLMYRALPEVLQLEFPATSTTWTWPGQTLRTDGS